LSPKSVKKLLSEARVTGSLEHPNVVPVHDIATDKHGAPLIVLKRIEGVHWGRLIADPDEQRERFGVHDPLEWNLRVLLSVANAIAFAHSRGVLHRDLKPENVMIGSFGEVYVLDWGLAVRLDDAPALPGIDAPRVGEALQMAGTPSYMAPEMLGGTPVRITERTDVYLLGAILYEILTGTPPHGGERLLEVLHSVARSAPTFPEDAPDELVDIARRAMARDPAARMESAEAFRDAVNDYLSHRASIALAKEAEKREEEIRAILEGDEDAEVANTDAEDADAALAARFAECRFGYHQALASWPGNERARDGKRRVLSMMARHALGEGDARGAARLLREIDVVDEALKADVARAVANERAERAELERLRTDRDIGVGKNVRFVVAGTLGAIWTVGPILAELSGASYGLDAVALATPPLVLLVILTAFAWVKRDLVKRTLINRQLMGATLITMIAEASIHLGGAVAGLSPAQTQSIALVLFGVVTAAMALMAAWPLVFPALGYLVAFFVAARFPELRAYAQSAANLAFTVIALTVWSRARADHQPFAKRDE
jgi:serine/threonine-protein kinase